MTRRERHSHNFVDFTMEVSIHNPGRVFLVPFFSMRVLVLALSKAAWVRHQPTPSHTYLHVVVCRDLELECGMCEARRDGE